MNTQEIRDLAIKRHDIDANEFQSWYTDRPKNSPFLYGRELVLDELKGQLQHVAPGSRALDVGSGTGHLTDWLRDLGFDVTGLEPSENMLSYARENFPDISFVKGISSQLPFEDNSFDFIVAFEVLRYLDAAENEATYREFRRVLKPGGSFFVTHVNRNAMDFYFPFYYLKGALYRLTNKTYHHCHFTCARDETELLAKVGFRSIHTVGRLSAPVRLAHKLGPSAFSASLRLSEKLFDNQRFATEPFRSMAGHLIVTATK